MYNRGEGSDAVLTPKIFILVQNNGFVYQKEDGKEYKTFPVEEPDRVPNTPFYYYLLDTGKTIQKQVTKLLKKESNSIFKPNFYVCLPDDAIETDRNLLLGFFYGCGAGIIHWGEQCQYMGSKGESYLSLSRAIILRYVRQGEILATRYYDKAFSDASCMKRDMFDLHPDCQAGTLPVMIYDPEDALTSFYCLGQKVELSQLMERFENAWK